MKLKGQIIIEFCTAPDGEDLVAIEAKIVDREAMQNVSITNGIGLLIHETAKKAKLDTDELKEFLFDIAESVVEWQRRETCDCETCQKDKWRKLQTEIGNLTTIEPNNDHE